MKDKGVAFITVLVFSIILGISASAFVFLTSSEVGAVKRQNNSIRAFYAAEAGIEEMYVNIKNSLRDDPWTCGAGGCSCSIPDGSIGGCTYSVTATTQRDSNVDIVITSAGSAGNMDSTVKVVYKKGPKNPFEGFSSGQDIDLHGWRGLFLTRWVNVNAQPGALFANGGINANQYTNVQGTQVPGADVPMPQFLETMTVDTDGDGVTDTERWVDLDGRSPLNSNANDSSCNHYYDVNGDGDPVNALASADKKGPYNSRKDNSGDGKISKADNPFIDDPEDPEDNYDRWNTEFDLDDINSDGEITEEDGFIWYYTKNLGEGENDNGLDYDIGQGEADYYSGDTYFGPSGETVAEEVDIVFVDGDVDMLFTGPSSWWGESDITVVATGNIEMTAPISPPGRHLNMVSYGNIKSGSNFFNFWNGFYTNMYAHGSIDINAGDWGVSRGIFGSMVANGGIDVGDLLLLSRHVSYDDWILGEGMAGKPLFPFVPAELKIGNKVSWQRE
jgi:hypothetical protein